MGWLARHALTMPPMVGPPSFKDITLPKHPTQGDWNTIPDNIERTDLGLDGLAFVLDNVFSVEESQALIDWSESCGYVKAALGHGNTVFESVRKSDRCIIDSEVMAGIIFKRIRSFLPETFEYEKLINVNERLRFLRYDDGGFFRAHQDGCYERPDHSEISFLTMQLYLNGGFDGGETTFIPEPNRFVPCIPLPGRVLIFQHDLRHEGSLLRKGRKYAVRSDVMYTQTNRY